VKPLQAYRGSQNRWDEAYSGKVWDTGRRHLDGAEMGYEADIGPRTNQGKPSLNHGFSSTFGPIIFTSYL